MNARIASLEYRIAGIEARMASIEAGQRWIIGIQVMTILSLGTLILVKLGCPTLLRLERWKTRRRLFLTLALPTSGDQLSLADL